MKPIFTKIPPAVAEKLGYYVYLYIDPISDQIFYVGKGKGSRAFAHLDKNLDEKRSIKRRIQKIKDAGEEPRIELLAYCLEDEQTALHIESAAIELLEIKNLANQIKGFRGSKFARMPLDQVIAHFNHKSVDIKEPAVLIRINQQYRYGITAQELYDATRSAWRISADKRKKIEYAFSIYEGVVREVYKISGWFEGGSTFNNRYEGFDVNGNGRWEFVGVLAEDKLRKKYINHYVGNNFKINNQNPIFYMNVEK